MSSKAIVIKKSDIGNRWDPEYHILLHQHHAAVEKLLSTTDRSSLIDLFDKVPYNKEVCKTIFRWREKMDLHHCTKIPDIEIALAIVASLNGSPKELLEMAKKREDEATLLRANAALFESLGIF